MDVVVAAVQSVAGPDLLVSAVADMDVEVEAGGTVVGVVVDKAAVAVADMVAVGTAVAADMAVVFGVFFAAVVVVVVQLVVVYMVEAEVFEEWLV
jgi:hypothetical protein